MARTISSDFEHHLSWHEYPGCYPHATRRDSTAAMVWSTFQRSWRRYFGTPDVMINDGGPEFRGDFAQSGKYAGTLQIIVDADAPWQNGKCERHGGLVKDLLAKDLETEVVFTPDDLEDLLAEIVLINSLLARIQEFHTSCSLTTRSTTVGMQELSRDDADLDSPAKAFRQSMRIRDHAARERLRSAGKAQLHRDRNYHRGQWVYVAKRFAWSKRSNQRSIAFSRTCCSTRWHHGWVSMRGRLWKCAHEQNREATNHESLGPNC